MKFRFSELRRIATPRRHHADKLERTVRRWSAHMHDIIDDPAYVALAESLVDEALAPLVAVTPPSVLPELRDFLVDELLCTEYGQAELLLLLPRDAPVQSDAAILRERVVTQVRARSDHARKHLG